jgi:hypothetical protein
VQLSWADLDGKTIYLDDLLSEQRFERNGTQLASDGLYVALDGHAAHVFKVT